MGQITWRNIDAPDFGQAGRLLEAGSRGVGDAFTGLQNLIGQQQKIGLANFENMKKQNTAALQNQLLGFKTPEEMAAAQEQFSPEALRARFGAAYDQGAINQLVAERPGQLRQDLTSQIQLGNLQQAEASEPYEQQFYALLAQSPKQAAQFLEQNKASFADTQKMYGDLANAQQQIVENQFKRQQLAEMAAGRSEARAERKAIADERAALDAYAQEYNAYAINHLGEDLSAKNAELQKKHGVNPVKANAIGTAVLQNVQGLSAPDAQQAASLNKYIAQNELALNQFTQDTQQEIDNAYLAKGLNPDIIRAQGITKTSEKDALGHLSTLLGDSEDAKDAFLTVRKILPKASNETIKRIVESSATEDYIGDDYSIDLDDIRAEAQKYADPSLRASYVNAQRLVDSKKDALASFVNSQGSAYKRGIAKARATGKEVASFNPDMPDYVSSRKELASFLNENLGKPKVK